ncbi:acyltransferase family protein [Kushneria indalinina]|uniref:Peptidoglycan/LPS O-acetylase OafA/YrhL n=1 Tax=Kushneria indalinina DSM 14324 TaxID=1122140 RepID=A0A3D9DV02_9GAMM|nr:acyltransferase [Kushneria indalinina]REC94608.1 peptidoglycan/LPS O-acetylase OafA/YrhL [Kushneria indalinina DSM 14324]
MLVSVQALRAFAAWLVVFHHFMQVFFGFDTDNPAGHLLSTRGQMGVDLFFVISGFVIYITTADRSMKTLRFLWQRAARIVPVYWFYTAVTAAILFFASDLMPDYGLDLPSLIMGLLFIPNENPAGFGDYPILPVGWTLNFEMMFYLVFALSFLLPPRARMWIVIMMIALLNLLLPRLDMISSFYTDPIIYEFLLGLGVGMLYHHGKLSPATTRTPWAILALGCMALMLCFTDQSAWRLAVWGLPAALLVIAMIRLEPIFTRCHALRQMGDQSYSVYLVHVIVLWLAHAFLHEHWGLPVWLTLAISLVIIATLSWASFELLEKQLSRRLKPPRRASQAA